MYANHCIRHYFSAFNLHNSRHYSYSSFTDEKGEAKKRSGICPRSLSIARCGSAGIQTTICLTQSLCSLPLHLHPTPLYPGLCDLPFSYHVMHSTLPRGSSRNGRTFIHTVRWRNSVHCSGPSCHVPLPIKLPTSTPSLIAVAVLQWHQTVPSSIWPHTHPSAQELHKYRKDYLSGSLDTRSIQRNCSKGFFYVYPLKK